MEAILLAGGKGERLGSAAEGRPKPLVLVAGIPLAAYQVSQLVRAGVERVLVSCASGYEDMFASELSGLGAEIVPVPEPEPLGRGGGIRFAAEQRNGRGPVFALNGDELIDVDLRALLAHHERARPAATITVTQMSSPFGVVDIGEDDRVAGFREAPRLPHWVSVGVYVLDDEALARFPERGDHELTTFPELASDGRLVAYRHEGVWLTVNTPKDLRRAEQYFAERPEWHPSRRPAA